MSDKQHTDENPTPTPTPDEGQKPENPPKENPPAEKPGGGSAFYKSKIEELEKQNREFQTMLEEAKTQKLKEKENFKELYEIERKKREAAEEKAVKISRDYLTGVKMSAIESEAIKAGIIPEALADIRPEDATMVEIETGDKGSVNILGAKEYVEYLKETKKHWFKSFQAPKINNGNPEEPEKPKELSGKDLIALQKKDPEKYKAEMAKRLKLA